MLPPAPVSITYTVKNTFVNVEVGDEDSSLSRRTSSRRAFSTCPDIVQATYQEIPKVPEGCSGADARSEDDAQPEDEPESEADPSLASPSSCRGAGRARARAGQQGHSGPRHPSNTKTKTGTTSTPEPMAGCPPSTHSDQQAGQVTTTTITTTTTIVSHTHSVPRILIEPLLSTTHPAPVTTSMPVMSAIPLQQPTHHHKGKGQSKGRGQVSETLSRIPTPPRPPSNSTTNQALTPRQHAFSKGKGKDKGKQAAFRPELFGKGQGKVGGKGKQLVSGSNNSNTYNNNNGNSHCDSSPSALEAAPQTPSKRYEALWCHLFINQDMTIPGFDLNQKIIGKAGCNTKGIYDATGAKIRLRGRGSGHMENSTNSEANVPLMLAITGEAHRKEDFAEAVKRAFELIFRIGGIYQAWLATPRQGRGRDALHKCATAPLPEGFYPCWIGEMSDAGRVVCKGIVTEQGCLAAASHPVIAQPAANSANLGIGRRAGKEERDDRWASLRSR